MNNRIGLPQRHKATPKRKTEVPKRYLDGFQMSLEGDCAMANQCWMPMSKKDLKQKWLDNNELYTSSNGRIYVKSGITYMDAVTGTLYRNGRCLSSDVLTTGELARDQEGASEILMALKADYMGAV